MALSKIPNNMQDPITSIPSAAITSVPGSALPAGTVLQTVSAVFKDQLTSNSTTFVNSGIQVQITPQFASSKILFTGTVSMSGYGHYGIRIARNGDDGLMLGTALNSMSQETHHHYRTSTYNTTYDAEAIAINYLDSPNTTTTCTYAIYFGCPHSSSYYIYLNSQYSNGNANWSAKTASHVTVQEIKQ